MWLGHGWLGPDLLTAGRTVSLEVRCRTSPKGRGQRHPVTLSHDWVLDTGHDLELERIGLALGGYLSCVELADRVLPAVRGLWRSRMRLIPPAIRSGVGDRWELTRPAHGCACEGSGFATPAAAVQHLSDVRHWALRHRAQPRAVAAFVELLGGALGVDSGAPPGVQVRARQDSRRVRRLVGEADGLEQLWTLGIPPEVVAHLHPRLEPFGEPVGVATYRVSVLHDVDPRWLAQFAEFGPGIVSWAGITAGEADLADPRGRLRWLLHGVHPHDIVVLHGGPITLADVQSVAALAGTDVRRVAAAAAGWGRLDCWLDPADLAVVVGHEHLRLPRFSAPTVDVLCRHHGIPTDGPGRTQVGLVLAAAGAAPLAEHLLADGVRTLSAALAIV